MAYNWCELQRGQTDACRGLEAQPNRWDSSREHRLFFDSGAGRLNASLAQRACLYKHLLKAQTPEDQKIRLSRIIPWVDRFSVLFQIRRRLVLVIKESGLLLLQFGGQCRLPGEHSDNCSQNVHTWDAHGHWSQVKAILSCLCVTSSSANGTPFKLMRLAVESNC